ncbi:hypothetical protein GCM10027290_51680 [Micromonospora sonneratiae]|uniref:CcmD family protein n=1 Tax=Micromonospora sonneratiae TaxID=1184706 RepID=A0ABW3YBS1_9ACTN
MTQTGGFAFLIAWSTFIALCGLLVYLILRRPAAPDRERADRRPAAPEEHPETDREEGIS